MKSWNNQRRMSFTPPKEYQPAIQQLIDYGFSQQELLTECVDWSKLKALNRLMKTK